MKKLAMLLALALVFSAGTAFAAWTSGTDGVVELGTSLTNADDLQINLSNKVQLNYLADTTDGLGYVLGTYHESGTRTYGSSSGDSRVFWDDVTASTALPSDVPTGTESADFSSWTAL